MDKFITKLVRIVMSKVEQKMAKFFPTSHDEQFEELAAG